MTLRRVREERLNELARTLNTQWTDHVPLSVRYAAAQAADRIVENWFAEDSIYLSGDVLRGESFSMESVGEGDIVTIQIPRFGIDGQYRVLEAGSDGSLRLGSIDRAKSPADD